MTDPEMARELISPSRKLLFICIAAIIACCVVIAAEAAASVREVQRIDELDHGATGVGAYRALVIGIDHYEDPAIADLETAVNDARAMAEVLETLYGFQVKTLLDRPAKSRAGWSGPQKTIHDREGL